MERHMHVLCSPMGWSNAGAQIISQKEIYTAMLKNKWAKICLQ
jgi:hypothetical protein